MRNGFIAIFYERFGKISYRIKELLNLDK